MRDAFGHGPGGHWERISVYHNAALLTVGFKHDPTYFLHTDVTFPGITVVHHGASAICGVHLSQGWTGTVAGWSHWVFL